ncbi:BTB/POZ fold [Penicillium camemberti]|uniref:BTB/POZ fold n=1 Tax=Penicillium camemberti (strain FM 013) TaxID=1429867 RepID=A0A0G4PKI3_PENC3|nr:BTB/POZ fold [Penicillium camemberti]
MSETSEGMETPRPSNEHFITFTLPLIHGPLVKIRIEPSNREYTVSKNLLCSESRVFSAMFQGGFRESQEQTATLQEIEGVLSIQSFEALLQWIYHRIIRFDETFEESCIEAAVELARLAEMYGITRIEAPITQYIKDIYAKSGHLNGKPCRHILPDDEVIVLGTDLREGHPVRRVMAQAFVLTYLQIPKDDRDSDDLGTEEFPKYGADLLFEVRELLDTLTYRGSAMVRDPITGRKRYLKKDDE